MKEIEIQNNGDFLETKILPMKIFSYYEGYFHDGDIDVITLLEDEIIFEMRSAEIYISDNRDRLPLSDCNRIHGRLHANKIISLKKNGQLVDSFKMEGDCIDILNLNLSDDRIHFFGVWIDYHAKTHVGFECEVIAKEIYWENTANTTDPAFLGKYMGLEDDEDSDFEDDNDMTAKDLDN